MTICWPINRVMRAGEMLTFTVIYRVH
jgi:hypothetical protein